MPVSKQRRLPLPLTLDPRGSWGIRVIPYHPPYLLHLPPVVALGPSVRAHQNSWIRKGSDPRGTTPHNWPTYIRWGQPSTSCAFLSAYQVGVLRGPYVLTDRAPFSEHNDYMAVFNFLEGECPKNQISPPPAS